jgi:hypothetical protein
MHRLERESFGARSFVLLLCVCAVFISGCFFRNNTTESGAEKLSKLGVVVKIPQNFQALSQEQLAEIGMLSATMVDAEPFTVNPLYAYADASGRGLIIISELEFMENIAPERFPMNNIYLYKKNFENYLASGEIGSEEIGDDDITTVLMTMVFHEDGDDIYLFKGLNYIYPDRFFMLDLYVVNKEITENDAAGYINMFDSLGIY